MAMPSVPDARLFGVMADGSGATTWGEMVSKRNRIAVALAQHLASDIIAGAVYGRNSVEWALCNQACVVLGLRFSPINWHLVADEVAYIIDDCDAGVVFFGREFGPAVGEVRPRAPKVKAWVCMDGSPEEGALSLESLMALAPIGAEPPAHDRRGGTVAYTGGTTGRPKGALRLGGRPPPQQPGRPPRVLEEWGLLRMMPHPVQLVAAPLYHAMPSAWLSIGLPLWTTFVFMAAFEAAGALAAVARHRVNGFYMPPILLKRLLQLPASERTRYDLSSVRTIMSGGAACPTSVKQGIVDMFGPVLFELYGASELGAVAVMPPEHLLRKPLSCGRLASGIDVVLLDDRRRRIETPGVAGEIFANGMNIDGYHKLEAKTREAQFGDYFSVGDVGYFDEEGFLYITDRKADMVLSGGVNIYPAQVEEILHQHPDVEDVAVFGVPDEEYGERVHAALKLAEGRQLTAKGLLEWCRGRIGKFQLPREGDITFHVEDFPRSEAGKLRKKALRAQVEAERTAPRSRL